MAMALGPHEIDLEELVRRADAAENQTITLEIQRRVRLMTLMAVATSPQLSVAEILEIIQSGLRINEDMRRGLAANPNCPEHIKAMLSI